MYDEGLFLNDLNMHDTSRDVILAGNQQSEELMELIEKVCNTPSNPIFFNIK
ncbi:unnamed protein product [Protopolystoma xenopodis]|uniref:guanylate cyclase n=1 Tax=Protopolystoma xenopodis TaxID=117903 RepID=A0A448X4M7_9PLAT|nr:unnamed protein product [Protopolystoma xenopodis]